MNAINLCLWILGLVLQAVLLFLLFRWKLVPKLRAFSILVGFYLLRAGALYALFPHLAKDSYAHLYIAFSGADFLLELLVVASIVLHCLRHSKLGQPGHRLKAAGLICAGVVLAIIFTALVPSNGRVPIDRGVTLVAFLMMLSFLWMALAHITGNQRHIAGGFATYGIAAIAAGIGRNFAALHHSRSAYSASSYLQTSVYLCIVVFWMIRLRPASPQNA